MANITIHLEAATDGSVAVLLRDGSARSRVPPEITEAGTFDKLCELIAERRPPVVRLSGDGSGRDGIGSLAFETESGQLDSRAADAIASSALPRER